MFEYLRGELIEANDSHAILDVNGLGYKILIPIHLHTKLPPKKSLLLLYTSLVIREDAHTMFGFQDKQERDLFEVLLNVSGIGPRTALSVIGHLPLPLFSQAVQTNNIMTFTKVPGIGKKTAERLLLELRGKTFNFDSASDNSLGSSHRISDALSALLQLGLSPTLARTALDKAVKEQPEADTSTLIAFALKAPK